MKSKYSFFKSQSPSEKAYREFMENMSECRRLEQLIAIKERTIAANNDYARRLFGDSLDRHAQISAVLLPISGFVSGLVQTVLAYAFMDPVPQDPENSTLAEEIGNLKNQLRALKVEPNTEEKCRFA